MGGFDSRSWAFKCKMQVQFLIVCGVLVKTGGGSIPFMSLGDKAHGLLLVR